MCCRKSLRTLQATLLPRRRTRTFANRACSEPDDVLQTTCDISTEDTKAEADRTVVAAAAAPYSL